jgi:hypothetical protein
MVTCTFGSMVLEMHYMGKVTNELDLYNFGILMLEVLWGKRPVNLHVEDPGEDFTLLQNV